MNMLNQAKTNENHTNNKVNETDKRFIQVINGVRVTLGCNPCHSFNLSILGKQKLYQTNACRYFKKTKPVFGPLEWIKSDAGSKYIANIHDKTEDVIFISDHQLVNISPVTIYTKSFYVWLWYLKHCIGDIDTAIKAELYY